MIQLRYKSGHVAGETRKDNQSAVEILGMKITTTILLTRRSGKIKFLEFEESRGRNPWGSH